MMEGIKEESVGYLFNLEVQVEQQVEEVPVQEAVEPTSLDKGVAEGVPAAAVRPEIHAKGLEAPQRPDRLHFTAPKVDGDGSVIEGDFISDEEAGPARSEADGLTRAERRKAQKSAGRRRKK